ncbi:MAG: tRNA pseudouridine(38-40) synthase TruA [Ignavibacteria bacterium]|nr:tRNA pseudouridine(38-40) synthase TruA [Ignavibacteria bacterium]
MPNIKGVVEYDGTNYSGWQKQLNSNSIQEEIEEALATLLRKEITIIGSGRTDSGVHALNQVFNFKVDEIDDLALLRKSLNAILPDDISVKSFQMVSDDFNSRFSAKSREYIYIISQRKNVFYDRFSWTIYTKLDYGILKNLQEIILNESEFDFFCKGANEIENFNCKILKSKWFIKKDFLLYWIEADRFIHGMVRALVGAMIDVSRGRFTIYEFKNFFRDKNVQDKPTSAPSKGLILYKVNY